MSQALFCPWASTIPQLCLGGPVWVSVLSLHSSLQEACDLHPTSRCTPSQVSDVKQGPAHASRGIFPPVPSIRLSGHCLVNEMGEDEAPHLQMRSEQCLHAYYTGCRSSRNKISSQVCSVNRKKQAHNEHNQLTNPKQVLFRLNGQRCKLNPTGFGLLSLGNTLLQLLTWAALKQCEQECKVFQFSQHGSRE